MDNAGRMTALFPQPSPGLSKRFGTVQQINADGTLNVVPDGSDTPVIVGKACNPGVGDRVAILVDGTQWLAIATVGGDVKNPYPTNRWLLVEPSGLVRPTGTAADQIAGTNAEGAALYRDAAATRQLIGLSTATRPGLPVWYRKNPNTTVTAPADTWTVIPMSTATLQSTLATAMLVPGGTDFCQADGNFVRMDAVQTSQLSVYAMITPPAGVAAGSLVGICLARKLPDGTVQYDGYTNARQSVAVAQRGLVLSASSIERQGAGYGYGIALWANVAGTYTVNLSKVDCIILQRD
jgi:hypothetical protein